MCTFYGPGSQFASQAEPLPGPTTERLGRKASLHQMYVLCGSFPEQSDQAGKVCNTSVLIDPAGDIIATYRKIHLMDADIRNGPLMQESKFYQPGSQVVTVETPLATFGLSICYDLRFPELYRQLAAQGAQILFIPAAFTLYTGKDHWEPLIRARAIENQAYVIAPGQFGFHPPDKHTYGKSLIVDPWGIVMAKASDRAMVIVAEIDLAYQENIRRELPSLANRRKDLFGG
jgi:predicted amidohydrolase